VQAEDNTATIASPDDVGVLDHHQSPQSPPRRKRERKPLHARITPSGPKRRPVAEIIHPEKDQDTAPPPLSQSAPRTVSAIIKATEGVAPPPPKGVTAHQWPPQRGPPSPLPTFIRFADLINYR
jgi:hypothetical protein